MSDLIIRDFNGHQIPQRADGYLSATAMCKANGKLWGHYYENASTKAFLEELGRSIGIPIDLLIVTVTKGPNAQRGTFVHPHIGYNLGQWCSPAFAVQVSQWIDDIRTKGYATAPGIEFDPSDFQNKIARQMAAIMGDKLDNLRREIHDELSRALTVAAAAQPGTALVTTHASANEIAIERGAKQKGRHGLTVRIGNFLELACRDAGEQVLPGRDGKRMFPRSIMMGRVLDYVDALVADHNRALDAQGDLLGTGRRRALAKVAQSEDARLPFLSEVTGTDFIGFLRLHQVDEDAMQPTVRKHGDWLLVRNIDRFDGDGLYLIEMGLAGHEYESCFRCDAHPDGYRLIRDNGAYGPPGVLSVEDFRRRVRAKVVYSLSKQDYHWPKAA